MRSLEDTALAFDKAARASGVNYAVVGGFTVSAWGSPRTTSAVDALVDLVASKTASFAAALWSDGLSVSSFDLESVLREGGHVTIFDESSSFHVDAKLCRTPDERAQVTNAVEIAFQGGTLRVVRPEETIAYKILYGTPQDLTDAASILARQGPKLDHSKLTALAIKLGVGVALNRLQTEVERARKGR